MRDGKTVLLTGATGFLGGHLCDALLREGGRVVALARPGAAQGSRSRVLEVLRQVSPSAEDDPAYAERLEVVDGDIARPGLGMDSRIYERVAGSVDEVWHCAASLSFLEEDREEIFRMNLEGTRNVVDLASRTPGRRLHHVSTAYVAGRRTGTVLEEEIDAGQEFKNPYEESKLRAEVLIDRAQEEDRITATVYRPSIVIGDSRSGKATHFHGVYAFIRGLSAVARRMARGRKDTGDIDLDLRIRGSNSSTLNFVPIDFVVEAVLAISGRESGAGRTFHVTNPQPTPNHLWKGIVCSQLGIRGVDLAGEAGFQDRPMNRLETLFHRQMAFYHPYLEAEPRFDSSGTESILEDTSIRCPEVTPEFAGKIIGWYIDRLREPGPRNLEQLEQPRL